MTPRCRETIRRFIALVRLKETDLSNVPTEDLETVEKLFSISARVVNELEGLLDVETRRSDQ